MTSGLVYDDGETTVTLWTRHGVTWERMTDPAETRYFHSHDDVQTGVMRGYRGWHVHRFISQLRRNEARFPRFADAIREGARLVREVCGDGCRQTRRASALTTQQEA